MDIWLFPYHYPDGDAISIKRSTQRQHSQYIIEHLLASYMAHPQVQYYPSGKPYLSDPGIHISIAHTGDYVVLAVDQQGSIGVDIECVDRMNHWSRLSKQFLSTREANYLRQQRHPSACFNRIWTFKEAWVKQQGLSVLSVRKVCFGIDDYQVSAPYTTISTELSGEAVMFYAWRSGGCFVTVAASCLQDVNVNFQCLSHDDLTRILPDLE